MEITKVEDESVEIQGWNAFLEKYKPEYNHINGNTDEYNHAFETYGAEVEYVKSKPNNHIWTRVQGDMSDLIVTGYHLVNRLEYYVTEVPWTNEDEYVLLSVEQECECYSEDEDVMETRNYDYGDPSCTKCEGYGYVTEYV